VDESTDELRRAHDELAELYAEKLADALDRMPIDRAVLGLFCDLVLESGSSRRVGDVGCGSGRLAPFVAGRGLEPHGVDLSPEMVRIARRDYPGFPFEVADVRDLPFADSSLGGVVSWYSLMYLHPAARPRAFGELARVIEPNGFFATAFKAGDNSLRRGGRTVGVEFDIYWLSTEEITGRLDDAGFRVVFSGGRPADPDEAQPQGYVIAQKT
jgi:ubiquinone/menaquinone biosynthesis C-methylase UbiE